MHYYLDILLLPDEIAGLNFLWEKVFLQVHLSLVRIKDKNEHVPIGLSFPGYDIAAHTLGETLRILARDRAEIDSLNIEDALLRFRDYIEIRDQKEVPATIATFARYRRQRAKSSIPRLARRRARRKGITEEQALADFDSFEEKRLTVPFVNARSLSGDSRFRLFILEEMDVPPAEGDFSCYGLSSSATVPVFK
jgi:CRISPR-associated endonuclease Csy4